MNTVMLKDIVLIEHRLSKEIPEEDLEQVVKEAINDIFILFISDELYMKLGDQNLRFWILVKDFSFRNKSFNIKTFHRRLRELSNSMRVEIANILVNNTKRIMKEGK